MEQLDSLSVLAHTWPGSFTPRLLGGVKPPPAPGLGVSRGLALLNPFPRGKDEQGAVGTVEVPHSTAAQGARTHKSTQESSPQTFTSTRLVAADLLSEGREDPCKKTSWHKQNRDQNPFGGCVHPKSSTPVCHRPDHELGARALQGTERV